MKDPSNRDPIISATRVAQLGGCHEISFPAKDSDCPDLPLIVAYTLPSGAIKKTRGFTTADGLMKARCYLNEEGVWAWEAKNLEGRCIETGTFHTHSSGLPGKLKLSQKDPRQLQYDNGKWYLNFCDNAFLFLSTEETRWKAYIDQAAQAGFNRVRTWLFPSTEALFRKDRKRLNLPAWDEIDQRLSYTLQRHPEIQFELILFGPDIEELKRFGDGDPSIHSALRYAIERFAPLPNVHWCLADGIGEQETDLNEALLRAGEAITGNDPWNSLISACGERFGPPLFQDQKWLSFQSIASLGQVTGEAVIGIRKAHPKPVALAQDRGEQEHAPRFPRYYFRRLFWGTLLSGGLPSYCGLITSEPFDRNRRGIEGYYDACNSGRLRFGAHDILQIKKFFADTGISLENWSPNDAISGNNPLLAKTAISGEQNECIAYVANPEAFAGHNPDGYEGHYSDESSDTCETFTTVTLELPFSSGSIKWYNPMTGDWKGEAEITKSSTTLLTPEPGDWVVWAKRD